MKLFKFLFGSPNPEAGKPLIQTKETLKPKVNQCALKTFVGDIAEIENKYNEWLSEGHHVIGMSMCKDYEDFKYKKKFLLFVTYRK